MLEIFETAIYIDLIYLAVECHTQEADHAGMKEWLKQHLEPASTIKLYMEKTVINRACWIKENSDLGIKEIMNEYPRLFDTPGMVGLKPSTDYDNLIML